MQSQSLEEIIDHTGKFLNELFLGEYAAILLIGAAARNEVSVGPDGTILSDLDFLVVLPQENLAAALIKEHQCRLMLGDFVQDFYKKHSIAIAIGFANASEKCWSQATPLMLELRENGRVLYGDTRVKNWPAIVERHQIPSWEGIRLVANRICELLGVIEQTPTARLNSVYASLKLALACSEAYLIDNQLYRTSYRDRLKQHYETCRIFSDEENKLILSAYHAKLGQNMDFYNQDVMPLTHSVLQLAISVLSWHRLYTKRDWGKRASVEQSAMVGLGTDILFFIQNLMNGKIISFRHPIMGIYADAFRLASEIADKNNQPINDIAFRNASLTLFKRYKITPQFVSIIHN